ncbi:hypothetical protein QAO71_17915 (plasmid) [Halopseudomonas sp. SMJS2]|uniref:tetratricopeptide repeat protein n=1 Tax=Halopseudomonas sp. SMJS2 TaxID=3041098 RepID=UPI002453581F|nr:hypothetical protein [Halopseudomonas sp. SMJS2]WGK63419.1 hypothetical protein QAO71_17915 [Halopseudomonas sp. SMJS2]
MMVKLNAGAIVLPRTYLSIAFLCLSIAGCASPNYNSGNDNPFNEPPPTPSAGAQQQSQPYPPRYTPPPVKATPSPQAEYRPAIVIPLDDEMMSPEVVVEVSSNTPDDKSRRAPVPTDEAFNEAMAYGAIGDSASMIGLLEQAARKGSADAHYELARVYQEGKLLPADISQSITHLNLAMNMGHAESIRVLGWLYLTGNGVPESPVYGRRLLEKAAETSIRAMREYGLALSNQRAPHLNDPDMGQFFLQKAAELGDHAAQQALVEFYGAPGPISVPEADSGPTPDVAEVEVEVEVEVTQPVEDNSAEGVKRRALAGDIDAAYLYALNVSIRKFPASDPEFEAYCWHAASAQLGSAQSASELRYLAGVKTHSDRRNPGRMDRCVSDLVEQMSSHPAEDSYLSSE